MATLNKDAGASAADCATTGVKTSYVCPAGKDACVRASTSHSAHAITTQIRVTRASGGAARLVKQAAGASALADVEVLLGPGDTVDVNCSVAVAASTAAIDFGITETDR